MKKIVRTDQGPAPVGPYNQAVIAGGFVFTAGQIAIVPASNEILTGGVAEQTRQVMLNLKAILEAAGSGLDKVVRTGVFLKDMNDFAAMNAVYAEFLSENSPARSTVEVSRLPKDVLVEIDCVATV
ncbi:MAG TPA: RidA family protein [Calditrichia bacterium]|nr:RidA family protein [Calditrichota bacterium]HQU70990.1 RidA family protein [Calditrichia bacterium]HQV30432.1 RidA family protein [Calditrichia bacterium]